MSTLLLIAQAFPPEPVVGALRAGNVARAFRDAGHEVIVVTAAMPHETPGRREWLPGVTIHTVALGPRYRERLTRATRRLQALLPGSPAASSNGGPGGVDPRVAAGGGLRALLLSLVWIPDDELRFVVPAYRAARRLLREHRVEVVYTTAPSHSTTLVGYLLRRRHGVRWSAEFRDPWCYPQSVPVTPFVGRVNRLLERRCIMAADHLVTVTDQTADLYRDRLGPAADKVLVVRNGIPSLSPSRGPARTGTFRIVYSGSIYGGRNPRAFLEAVALVARDPDAMPLEVDIYVGEARSSADVSLESCAAQLGIGPLVRFSEWVPHEEVQGVLHDANLLLLLAQRQPLQVPNKLYEYLGTQVPILAIADAEGETARMLERIGGHYVVTRDEPAVIAGAIRAAMAGPASPPAASAGNVLTEWSTDRQMARLVDAIRPGVAQSSRTP